jgi:hypothetical protein
MTANAMRVLYVAFAALLFFFAGAIAGDGGGRDIVRASAVIGFCLGGCVALLAAAIVRKDA